MAAAAPQPGRPGLARRHYCSRLFVLSFIFDLIFYFILYSIYYVIFNLICFCIYILYLCLYHSFYCVFASSVVVVRRRLPANPRPHANLQKTHQNKGPTASGLSNSESARKILQISWFKVEQCIWKVCFTGESLSL